MAGEFVEKFGFDVVGAGDLEFKLNKALKAYNKEAGDINKVHAQFNREGKAVRVTVQGLDSDNRKFITTLKNSKGAWKNLGTEVDKTVKSLTNAQKRFKEIYDSESIAIKKRNFAIKKGADDAAKIRESELRALRLTNAKIIAEEKRVASVIATIRESEKRFIRGNAVYQVDRQKGIDRYGMAAFSTDAENARRGAGLLAQQFERTGKIGKKAGEEVLLSWRSVQRLFVIQLFHQAIASFRIQLQQASVDALSFAKKITEIRTLSQDTAETTGQWSSALLRLSDSFGIDILDTAKSAYEALSDQIINQTSQLRFLDTASRLAIVGNAELIDSENALGSVINSFNLSLSEQDRVAAILFKTVDLGKTTLNELAQNLGRVNVQSKILGVSFEEQQAALSTLTIQGLKDHTAKTLLSNVYQKLIHPSKELKEVFDSWGVSSGQAAIQAFGFSNVLQRIVNLAQQSGDPAQFLGDVVTEIRAQTGVLALDLTRFNEFLTQFQNPFQNFEGAAKISLESVSQQVQVQFNKVRNLFLGFGQTINETFLSFTKTFGDAATVIKGLIALTVNLVETYVAYKAAIASVAVYHKAMLVVYATQRALNNQTAAFVTILRGLAVTVWPLAAAAGIFALVSYINYTRQWGERIKEAADQAGESFRKFNEEHLKQSIKLISDWGAGIDKTAGKFFSRLAQINVAFTQANNKLALDMDELNKKFVESAKNLFKEQTRFIDDEITAIQQKIRDAEKKVKDFEKGIIDNGKKREDFILQFQLQRATGPLDKVRVADREIARLQGQLNAGNLSDEQLLETHEQLLEIAKKRYDFAVDSGDRGEITQSETRILNILREQTKEFDRQRIIQDQIAANEKARIDQLKRDRDFFKEQLGQLNKLDKDSTIQDFTKVKNALLSISGGLDPQTQIALQQLLNDQEAKFNQNDGVTKRREQLARLRADQEQAEAILQNAKKALLDLRNSMTEITGAGISTSIEEAARLLEGLNSFNFGRDETLTQDQNQRQREQFERAKEILAQLKGSQGQLSFLQASGNFQGIAAFGAEQKKLASELFNIFNELRIKFPESAGKTASKSIDDLYKAFDPLATKFKEFTTTSNDIGNLTQTLATMNQQIDVFKDIVVEADSSMVTANTSLVDAQEVLVKRTGDMVAELNKLRAELAAAGSPVNDGSLPPPQARFYGGRIGYYASGGRGTDTQLAYLTPGEYVWDRETVRKNYPIIRGIHEGTKYMNNGGSVGASNNYNFGNINVTGGKDAEQTANQIIRTIKRAIRTGQLSGV